MTARGFIVAVQLAVTVAAITALAWLVDWRDAGAALVRIGPAAAAMAVVLAAASQVVGAWRLSVILGGCGVPVGFRRSVTFTWVGLFAANVLPATVGADALYALLLGRAGMSMGAGLFGLICNRVINVLVILSVLPWTPLLLPVAVDWIAPALPSWSTVWVLVGAMAIAAAALGLGVLVWWRRRPRGTVPWHRLLEPVQLALGLARRPWIGFSAIACSYAMLGMGAWALLWLARDIVPNTDYASMLAVLALTLATQIVPLSINGIGVQEAVFTVVLVNACNWSPGDAAAFGILARVLGIAISLPGLPATLRILRRKDTATDFCP